MAVDPQILQTVRELLKACSAQIVGTNGGRGTGFFVDEQLLLTCAHVVQGGCGDKVEILPFGRSAREGVIADVRPAPATDLALVEVCSVDAADRQPAVLLDARLKDEISYYAVGYPREELLGGRGLEEIPFQGHRRLADDGSVSFLVLEAGGPLISPGLSGGPLLSGETGAVVALVQYANSPGQDSGGAAIPIERAAREFEEILRLVASPPVAARRWRDSLGRNAWEALGKIWGWRCSHDIVLEGTRHRWQVKIDSPASEPQQLTVRNLPDEVAEALFDWAQRRRPRRADEVRLLGRLLAAAVFPETIAHLIERDRQADDLRVRLRVEGDSDLFDVPWEFVTVNAKAGDMFSTSERGISLVRVAPHRSQTAPESAPVPGEAGVLATVVQPTDWQDKMPSFVYGGRTVNWPEENEISHQLRDSVKGGRGFRFLTDSGEPLTNPAPWQFPQALATGKERDAPLEVVHYIGFGHVEGDTPKLAFSDDLGDVEWMPVSEFLEYVAASGARLLVVEFALPRFDMELEPVSPRAFLPALENRVTAVVFTRFPVHPRQFRMFNTAFYEELGNGRSVESAMQQARWRLYRSPSLDDTAAFGWFTLVIAKDSELRIFPSRAPTREGALEAAPRQPGFARGTSGPAQSRAGFESFAPGTS